MRLDSTRRGPSDGWRRAGGPGRRAVGGVVLRTASPPKHRGMDGRKRKALIYLLLLPSLISVVVGEGGRGRARGGRRRILDIRNTWKPRGQYGRQRMKARSRVVFAFRFRSTPGR